jgi:hypothetical protein
VKLLDSLMAITIEWNSVFQQERTVERARQHAAAHLCALGRKTLSSSIVLLAEDGDWSTNYRLFSRANWNADELFRPVVRHSRQWRDEKLIAVAWDDTKLKKTGRKIATASWHRDPMSPHFAVNLLWGLRFLQASVLLPLYRDGKTPARALPIRFTEVPVTKKPKKKAPEEEWQRYKKEIRRRNLSTAFCDQLRSVRSMFDEEGEREKTLLAVVDGSFCNRICFSGDVERTHILARTRKNAKLCFAAPAGSRGVYSKTKFTPESYRQDDDIKWQYCRAYHGGSFREVWYKEVMNVLWQGGTRKRPLRLIVVAPTPYRRTKTGRLMYRDPAYLLTTDFETSAAVLLQKYFDRWEIEVNHREEKDTLGVGQAQVRSCKSVSRQPAFQVASYSALHLAALMAFGPSRTDVYSALPRWRKKSKRPSCLDLIRLLRLEMSASHRKDAANISMTKLVSAAAA